MSKPVYRLENHEGHGPFHGDQPCVGFLRPHYDPEDFFKAKGFSRKVFDTLTNAGLVFGWRTQQLYHDFFKPRGQSGCLKHGFSCVVYRPDLRLELPDGQVMFLREKLDPSDNLHNALAVVLGEGPFGKPDLEKLRQRLGR